MIASEFDWLKIPKNAPTLRLSNPSFFVLGIKCARQTFKGVVFESTGNSKRQCFMIL